MLSMLTIGEFVQIFHGNCDQTYKGIIENNRAILCRGVENLLVYDYSTDETSWKNIGAVGSFYSVGNQRFIVSISGISELLNPDNSELELIEPNLLFPITIFSFDVTRDGIIYLTSNANLFRSEDQGESWTKIDFGHQSIKDIHVAYDGDLHIFGRRDYFFSDDRGYTFERRPHNLFGTMGDFQYNIATYSYVLGIIDSLVLIGGRGCVGLSGPTHVVSDDLGERWEPYDYRHPGHSKFFRHNNQVYGFSNSSRVSGLSIYNLQDLSSEEVNPELPTSCLIIDENLVHYNDNNQDNVSYYSTDLGKTYTKLKLGPRGSLF